MFRSSRRFSLAALVFVLLVWVPVGTAQADVRPVSLPDNKYAHNHCGATVVRSEPVTAVPLDVRLEYASSLLAHELGQALFQGHVY
jgi:hypothetical protein